MSGRARALVLAAGAGVVLLAGCTSTVAGAGTAVNTSQASSSTSLGLPPTIFDSTSSTPTTTSTSTSTSSSSTSTSSSSTAEPVPMPSDMDAYGDGAFGAVFVDPTSEDNEACKGYAACWSIDVWSGAECPEGITLSLTVYDGPGDDADAPVLSTLTQTEAPSGGVAAGSVTHMMATTSGEGATSDTLSVTLDDVGCADL